MHARRRVIVDLREDVARALRSHLVECINVPREVRPTRSICPGTCEPSTRLARAIRSGSASGPRRRVSTTIHQLLLVRLASAATARVACSIPAS